MYQDSPEWEYSRCRRYRQIGVWMMRKKGKTLAACLFAAVWWGIFYPELCFTEETCEAVRTDETQADGMPEEIGALEIWCASGDEIVISSRFLEWLEENLSANKD